MVFSLISPMVDIAVIAVVLVIVFQAITRKVKSFKRMREIQKEMKPKQKRYFELLKKNDSSSKAELERIAKEMSQIQMEMMPIMMKQMMVSFVIFIPALYAMNAYDGGIFPVGEFVIPVINSPVAPYYVWYIICSITASIIAQIGIAVYGKIKAGGKKNEAG